MNSTNSPPPIRTIKSTIKTATRTAVTTELLSDNYTLRAVLPGAQEQAAFFSYQAVVLDPETDIPLRNINTGFDGKTITCFKFFIPRTDIMNVKSQIVGSVVSIVTAHVLFRKIIRY